MPAAAASEMARAPKCHARACLPLRINGLQEGPVQSCMLTPQTAFSLGQPCVLPRQPRRLAGMPCAGTFSINLPRILQEARVWAGSNSGSEALDFSEKPEGKSGSDADSASDAVAANLQQKSLVDVDEDFDSEEVGPWCLPELHHMWALLSCSGICMGFCWGVLPCGPLGPLTAGCASLHAHAGSPLA